MKRFKNLLMGLLVVVLLISIVACSAPGKGTVNKTGEETRTSDKKKPGTNENDNQDETADIMTPYGKYPEAIEMHTAKRASSKPNFVEGDTVEDNAMTRYVQDKLNVKLVVDWEVEGSEFINKLSLNIVSDDLPDMFTLGAGDYLVYKQLLENDKLADLTEAYEKCAGDYMKDVFSSYDNKNLEPYTEDGKLYGIAGGRYGYEHNLLWLRKDWMEECNLEVPKTVEDIKHILTVFKEKNPGGHNVGMILNATDPAGGYGSGYSATPIFEAYGATPKTWIKDKNGDIVYGSVAPEMKEGLKVLAEWYKEGLIDKQFPTRTDGGANDAVWNGSQSGVVFAPWHFSYTEADLPRNNPDAEVIPVNAPLDSEGNFNVIWPGPSGDAVFINKKYEHPEAVVKVMNAEYDMWRGFDPEGTKLIKPNRDANVDWGYMFPTSGVNLEYADIIPNVGLLAKNYIDEDKLEGAPSATEMDKEMARDAKNYADTKSLEGMGWVHYHGRYLGSNLVNTPEVKITYPIFSFTTESMADLKPNLDTLESTAFLQIITGEKPVDYFDEFVKQWYAQGGDTVTKEVKNEVKNMEK